MIKIKRQITGEVIKVYTARAFPLISATTFLFIACKVFGVIDWNWLWVVCPLWLPIAVPLASVVGLFTILGVCWLVLAGIVQFNEWRRRLHRRRAAKTGLLRHAALRAKVLSGK